MLTVPVQPVPSQKLSVVLGGQSCTLKITQRRTGLYLDLYVNNALVLGGVIFRDRARVVRNAYFNFVGDFCTVDTQGAADPSYDGLGSQFLLVYLEAADIA